MLLLSLICDDVGANVECEIRVDVGDAAHGADHVDNDVPVVAASLHNAVDVGAVGV